MKITRDTQVKIVVEPFDPAMTLHVRVAGFPTTVPVRFLPNGDGTWTGKIPKAVESNPQEKRGGAASE